MNDPHRARIMAISTMFPQVMNVLIKILAVIGKAFFLNLPVRNQPATKGWMVNEINTRILIPKTDIRAMEFSAGCFAVNNAATPKRVVAEDNITATLYENNRLVRYL